MFAAAGCVWLTCSWRPPTTVGSRRRSTSRAWHGLGDTAAEPLAESPLPGLSHSSVVQTHVLHSAGWPIRTVGCVVVPLPIAEPTVTLYGKCPYGRETRRIRPKNVNAFSA